MGQPDTWYAYFHLRGSFDPDEVTRTIGVTPTETAREGDPIGGGTKRRPCSLWALHARDKSAELELQVKDVLDQLDSNRAAFQRLSREHDGSMELVGYFRDREPGVALDRTLIERIAGYALTLDCDFYNE
jgi:Domain of unknown function (DUF4279)